jgi:NAD(P)H dehydrogenase (quinone)
LNVFIVHAHPEPQSFSSALARTAAEILAEMGHSVTVSDLYAMDFDPVSGRKNFTTVKDPDFFKQQQEELHATEYNGFAPEIEAEIRKLEAADLLIFSFPLWWFGMPGTLKGWVDRVFPMGRVYGGTKFYENGLGSRRKARALVLMTTGGGPIGYSGHGAHTPLSSILAPVHHGIFWFNGFQPLEPFVAWSVARISDAERVAYLERLRTRLQSIFDEPAIQLPPLADFPEFGPDTKKRFHVVVSRKHAPDEAFLAKIPAEKEHLAALRREGFVLQDAFSPQGAEPWRGFLTVRAASDDEVQDKLRTFPLFPNLNFEVYEIA